MNAKLFELRDRATFVPVLAVLVQPANEQEAWLLRHSGYGFDQFGKFVIMTGLAGGTDKATCDPHDWPCNRTRTIAHEHIAANWDNLETGAVIDVQFIIGETSAPKTSERKKA